MLLTESSSEFKPLMSDDTDHDPLGFTSIRLDNRKRFLKFLIYKQQEALLPLCDILEVMQLPRDNILAIPDMPSEILGMCSWQSRTLWLVELNCLVGYRPTSQPTQLTEKLSVVVIQHEHQTIGLVVDYVGDVDLIDTETIHTKAGLCSPKLDAFVYGHCPQQKSLVMSVPAIVSAPELHIHSPIAFDEG